MGWTADSVVGRGRLVLCRRRVTTRVQGAPFARQTPQRLGSIIE